VGSAIPVPFASEASKRLELLTLLTTIKSKLESPLESKKEKVMKFLFISLLIVSPLLADENPQNLEEAKQRILANIEERITSMQSHKSCVQAATSKEQIKSCHDSHHAQMEKIKAENQAEREAMKAQRKDRKKQ
jgi:hypothetical protein